MSLKNFLAVGKSFVAKGSDKSPYAMRKDQLLPKFGSAPRFTQSRSESSASLVQADWLQAPSEPAPSEQPVQRSATSSGPAPSPLRVSAPPKRGLLSYLSFGLLGKPKKSPLVQSELALEKIQVIRNDLADSDLELVVVEKRKRTRVEAVVPAPARPPVEPAPAPAEPARARKPESRQPWSELAARLFEAGQNQR